MSLLKAVAAALWLVLLPGGRPHAPRTVVTVMGATSLLAYARSVIRVWSADHPGVRVALAGGGSWAGWHALRRGTADLALSDLDFSAPPSVAERIIGRLPILFVAHPGTGVGGVDATRLRAVFSGAVTNWRDLGGRPLRIVVVARQAGSGSREVVATTLLGGARPYADVIQLSNGAVARTVAETPGAVGYVEGARAWPEVRVLSVSGRSWADPGWPFVARPRVYYRTGAGSPVRSLAEALATSTSRSRFGIAPDPLRPRHAAG